MARQFLEGRKRLNVLCTRAPDVRAFKELLYIQPQQQIVGNAKESRFRKIRLAGPSDAGVAAAASAATVAQGKLGARTGRL